MARNSGVIQENWIQTTSVQRIWPRDIPPIIGNHGDMTSQTGSARQANDSDVKVKGQYGKESHDQRQMFRNYKADQDEQMSHYAKYERRNGTSSPDSPLTKSPRAVSPPSNLPRRLKRDLRERPWTKHSRQKPTTPKVATSETHYELCLPKEQWMNMRPMRYVKNPRWGQAFQIKKNPATKKPFKPKTEEWLIENDFHIWLFEKAKSSKLELTFAPNGPFVMNVKNVNGRRHVDKIGAHRDLYEQFHSERIRKQLELRSVVLLQRNVRGWLIRHKLKKLQKEVELFHGVSWQNFTRYYKALMTRLQRRSGIENPETRFDLNQVKKFLQKKAKYEKMFYEIATEDKVPRDQIQRFFNVCGLKPTEAQIEEGFKTVFKGCSSRAEVVLMLDCSSGLTFSQTKLKEEFVKEFLGELDLSKDDTRVAVVPFNCKGINSLGLGDFNCRENILQAIDNLDLKPGSYQCGSSIRYTNSLLNTTARVGAPKHCIVVINNRAKVTKLAEREATGAKENGTGMIVIGLGNSSENKNLNGLASSSDHVFRLTDMQVLDSLKKEVLSKMCLHKCMFCKSLSKEEEDPFHYQVYDSKTKKILNLKIQPTNSSGKEHVDTTPNGGLLKPELMELLWTLYPPEPTGLPPRHKSSWMRPIVNGEEFADIAGDTKGEFEKCLEIVLKSKLDRDGSMVMPVGMQGVEEVNDYNMAFKYAKEYITNKPMDLNSA